MKFPKYFKYLNDLLDMHEGGTRRWTEIWPKEAPDGFHRYRFIDIILVIHKKCKWCKVFNNNNWTRSTLWLIFITLIGAVISSCWIVSSTISHYYTIEYNPMNNMINTDEFNKLDIFAKFTIENGVVKTYYDYNQPMIWVIFGFSIIDVAFFIDSLCFQISVSRNKFLKEDLKIIYSWDCPNIMATKPLINVSKPWKSMSPYVLLITSIVVLTISIGDIVISSIPPSFSIQESEGAKYILLSTPKYTTTDIRINYSDTLNCYFTFVDLKWSPLYYGLFWMPLATNILAMFVSIYWGNRTVTTEIGHVVFRKLKDPEYQKELGLTEEEIKLVKEAMESRIRNCPETGLLILK